MLVKTCLALLFCVVLVHGAKRLQQSDEDPSASDFSGSDSSDNRGTFSSGNGGRISGSASSGNNGNSGRRSFGQGDSNSNAGIFAPTNENFDRLTTQDPRLDSGSDSSSSRNRGSGSGTSSRFTSGDNGGSSSSNRDRNSGSLSGTSDRDISDRISGSGSDRDSGLRGTITSGSRGSDNSAFSSGNSDGSRGSDNSAFSSGNSDGSRGSDNSAFSSGNSDRDSSSSFDRRSTPRSTTDRFSGRGRSFPDNLRIEIEVLRLEDKAGILATGKSCDVLSACDPKIYADIDTVTASSSWPKDTVYNKWPVIFQKTNDNNPTINVVVNRDICNGDARDTQVATVLRARVVDADSLTTEDDMSKFDCSFTLRPQDVGTDPLTTPWGNQIECTGYSQQGKIRLYARERSYGISSSECNSQRRLAAVTGPKP